MSLFYHKCSQHWCTWSNIFTKSTNIIEETSVIGSPSRAVELVVKWFFFDDIWGKNIKNPNLNKSFEEPIPKKIQKLKLKPGLQLAASHRTCHRLLYIIIWIEASDMIKSKNINGSILISRCLMKIINVIIW